MKKYLYTAGIVALALALGALPAVTRAENGYDRSASGEIRVNLSSGTQTEGAGASTSLSAQIGESEKSSKDQEQESEATSSENQEGDHATSSERAQAEVEQHAAEQAREHSRSELFLELEGTTTPAFSLAELKQSIEQRKHELDQEEASTTPEDRDIVEHANSVRLAVHTLLASKNLLGGIGQHVSDIAQLVNDSLATTTNAEVTIQARGFFARLFFGGDSRAAGIISQEVAQNERHIQEIAQLLDQANVSVDIQTTLKAQITALQDAQARLQDLAQEERGQWGLFSWRF